MLLVEGDNKPLLRAQQNSTSFLGEVDKIPEAHNWTQTLAI